jgi:hypothetical protein
MTMRRLTSGTSVPLRLGFLVLCCAAFPGASWPTGSGTAVFGACTPGAKHADVPAVHGLSYDDARKKIIAAGWKPNVTRTRDRILADSGNAPGFLSRGYKEIDRCLPTGIAACEFSFVDKVGNRLVVYTVGEEYLHSHATVDVMDLQCRG